MVLTILFLGFLFGFILQYAKLNKYDIISGLARMENFAVLKALLLAIGIGAIMLNIEIGIGIASYHIKPLFLGGVVIGGLIFGSGMAILGYCPGTMFVSLGEGSIDALVGIFGGLSGGLFYTAEASHIVAFLGRNFGKISLNTVLGNTAFFYFLVVLIGIGMIIFAFWLDKKELKKDKKWIISGVGLAILNLFVFAKGIAGRPIGASTSYPYIADVLTGYVHNSYFFKISKPGHWEMLFLAGAFLAGLIFSLIKKDFKFVLLHNEWKRFKGSSAKSRLIWSFVGGFILIFGARLAGGCTSGHILSGGMQLAFSSLIFSVFVFVGLFFSGYIFYRKK
jgi:hypothetical protein